MTNKDFKVRISTTIGAKLCQRLTLQYKQAGLKIRKKTFSILHIFAMLLSSAIEKMLLKNYNLLSIGPSSWLIFLLALTFSFLQFPIDAFSQCSGTATFTGSGTFGTGGATASYTGTPATACTIIIPSGITITINGNTTWNGDVQISGTLILSQRLTIGTGAGCGLEVLLQGGGKISDDPNAGGSNERLVICGKTILTTQPNPPSGAYNWPTPAGTGYAGPGSIGEDFNGVLPIELVYFNATCIDQQVLLSWATSTEENFDYFDIERSMDGIEFQSVGSLQGVGGKNQLTKYSHIDYVESSGRY